MNASHSPRRLATIAASVGLAAVLSSALAGCAQSPVLTERVTASPPLCMSNPAGPSLAAPMLGCANRANLAAMVADPHDLVQGRPETPALGNREAVAVENLKKGPEKKTGALTPATTLITTSGATGAQ